MKIEILLVALAFSFSQASYDVNRTINPLGHPNNEVVPVNPEDPVKSYNFEHTAMMFFTGLQHFYTGDNPNDTFLDCLEENIYLYNNFSTSFTKNLTDVSNSIKNSLMGQNKPKNRAAKALINLAAHSKEFGQKIELAAQEENSVLAKKHIKVYSKKIKKCEFTLLKALNRLAKTYTNEISKIDARLKEINLQTQKEANNFIAEIIKCMRNLRE